MLVNLLVFHQILSKIWQNWYLRWFLGCFINYLDYFIKKYIFSNVVLFALKERLFKKTKQTKKKKQLAVKHEQVIVYILKLS